jgi:hypothetical protein
MTSDINCLCNGDDQAQRQALLDARLATFGWDASLYRLDPVWKFHRIFDIVEEGDAIQRVGTVSGLVQAPSEKYILDALQSARLVAKPCRFDRKETERRLRASELPEEQILAALNFTALTGVSVFSGYGPEWRELECRHREDHERLLKRHDLLLTLASMRGPGDVVCGRPAHKDRGQA